MKPEAQRIAIAEACGWHWSNRKHDAGWKRPDGTCGGPPDYLSDLNAMHEAEKVLTDEQRLNFGDALASFYATDKYSVWWHLIHSTAAQRAEAFLRTIGKWEESE